MNVETRSMLMGIAKTGTSQRGIALLMVLWVLVVLMVIALSFSVMARTETHSTLSFKESMEARFLAEAGIERGVMELFYRKANRNQNNVLEGSEILKTDGTPYKGHVGNGRYTLSILDESGKININTMTDTSGIILNNLLVNAGLQKEAADTIVDSILDWRDADESHRLHGAESEYYLSLPNPYRAKNADFDTLEELLLVKGITSEILYGNPDGDAKGIVHSLSVHSGAAKININAAPKEVLMALPGMTKDKADRIMTFRQSSEIKNLQDIQEILGESAAAMAPYVGTGDSNTFMLAAFGYRENEQKGYGIRATVVIEGNSQYRYAYYKSPALIAHDGKDND